MSNAHLKHLLGQSKWPFCIRISIQDITSFLITCLKWPEPKTPKLTITWQGICWLVVLTWTHVILANVLYFTIINCLAQRRTCYGGCGLISIFHILRRSHLNIYKAHIWRKNTKDKNMLFSIWPSITMQSNICLAVVKRLQKIFWNLLLFVRASNSCATREIYILINFLWKQRELLLKNKIKKGNLSRKFTKSKRWTMYVKSRTMNG